jgi:hypothetical protein
VLAENEPMLAVFRRSGLPMQLRRDGSVLHVTLALLLMRTDFPRRRLSDCMG